MNKLIKINLNQTVSKYLPNIGSGYADATIQNVLNMNDAQIKEMQNQINKEAGSDVEDGGIDIPPDSDGITRVPADDDNGGNNE